MSGGGVCGGAVLRPLVVGLVAAVFLAASPSVAVSQVTVRYVPPVPGTVLRGFEAPPHPYASGHRGLDLAVEPGEVVRAAARGEVVFAGPVVGEVWVSIRHPDGIRTAYGELSAVQVAVGDQVALGDPVGRATGRHRTTSVAPQTGLHVSARRGDRYLDPSELFGAPPPRRSLVGPGGWWGTDPVVVGYDPYTPGRWRAGESPSAERPGFALPPNHHHLVMVPGFATEGPHELFDPGHLGYGTRDVSGFSYAGCEATASGCLPRPYDATDTHVDRFEAAQALADHLRGRQREQPWRPVDLVAHSMGGDVVVTYLEHLHDPADPTLPPIGSVVTYGTPFGGSGVAQVGRALSEGIVGSAVGEGLLLAGRLVGVPGADRLSLTAPAVGRYGGWRPPDRVPGRLEDLGVSVHTFGGSRDAVVSPFRSSLPGTAPTVLPGSHGGMVDTEAALLATHAALGGGTPVGSEGRWDRVLMDGLDAVLHGAAAVIDVAELSSKARLVARGVAGVRRLLTEQARLEGDGDVVEVVEDAVDAGRGG